MLLAFKPGAREGLLIRHHVDAIALSLVQLVETFVAAAIWIFLHAEPIHFLVDPVTCVLLPVGPSVGSKAFNKAIFVRARVSLTIRPLLNTVSISLAVCIVSKELSAIGVGFSARTFHDSFAELALVDEEVHVS